MVGYLLISLLFFFNDTATTEIYTLSLHDALPIYLRIFVHGEDDDFYVWVGGLQLLAGIEAVQHGHVQVRDRKSTRLNSSHQIISYAVFCLKKKKYRK